MTTQEAREMYEKYKHLDYLFSDKDWLPNDHSIWGQVIFDFWQTIKEIVKNEEKESEEEEVQNA